MADEKFVWCRNCNEVHHVTAYDKAPLYDGELPDPVAVDDWRAFMRRHTGHSLEALRSSDQVAWEGGSSDPMQQRYIEVTNGRGRFVVRGFRTSIHEPLRFEAIPGRLSAKRVALEVQGNEIRKELKRHFPWGMIPPGDEKIDLFIGLFQQLVSGLAPEDIRASYIPYGEADAGYGALNDELVENLLQKCVPYFVPEELSALKRFLAMQRDSEGVMALRFKYEYTIDSSIEASQARCDSK
ncbi:MAG: hypothetical protein ACREQW_24765 [Candidatus Binatia bacterium]